MNRVIRISRQFRNNAHFHGNCDKMCHVNPDFVGFNCYYCESMLCRWFWKNKLTDALRSVHDYTDAICIKLCEAVVVSFAVASLLLLACSSFFFPSRYCRNVLLAWP